VLKAGRRLNGGELPGHTQINLSVSHKCENVPGAPLEARFDVINVADMVYQIRIGSGVGVFAPQFGPRRGFSSASPRTSRGPD
jgi:hypothetical protein